MNSPVKKRRFDWLLILLFIAGVVGILADLQEYNEVKDGTAAWKRNSREPWYFSNPDGFLIFTVISVLIYSTIIFCAIANFATKKEQYRKIGIGLIFLIQIISAVNKMIKG